MKPISKACAALLSNVELLIFDVIARCWIYWSGNSCVFDDKHKSQNDLLLSPTSMNASIQKTQPFELGFVSLTHGTQRLRSKCCGIEMR